MVLPEISRLGASLIVITPQLESYNRQMHKKLNLNFDIVGDRRNQIASEFGLTFSLPRDLR